MIIPSRRNVSHVPTNYGSVGILRSSTRLAYESRWAAAISVAVEPGKEGRLPGWPFCVSKCKMIPNDTLLEKGFPHLEGLFGTRAL